MLEFSVKLVAGGAAQGHEKEGKKEEDGRGLPWIPMVSSTPISDERELDFEKKTSGVFLQFGL